MKGSKQLGRQLGTVFLDGKHTHVYTVYETLNKSEK